MAARYDLRRCVGLGEVEHELVQRHAEAGLAEQEMRRARGEPDDRTGRCAGIERIGCVDNLHLRA